MLSMWSLPGYGLCENKNEKYGKFTCVNTTRLLSSRKFQLKPRKTYGLDPTRRSSLRKFEQKQLKLDIQTLPGYPICENLNKTGFLVVCSLFYLPYVMKFSIESSFPCYYGISVFNLHNQILSFTKQVLNPKRYIIILCSIDSFLSYLSLFLLSCNSIIIHSFNTSCY